MTSNEKQKSPEVKPDSEEDIITKCIGNFGRWQLTFTFILSLANFPCTWHIYALTFQGSSNMDFYCTPPPGLASLPEASWRNISHVPDPSNAMNNNPCKIWDVDYSKYTPETILGHDFKEEGAGTRDCEAWTFNSHDSETLASQWGLVCNKKSMISTAEMVFLAGVAFGGLISGFLSDRFGRKKTLLTSVLLQIVLGISLAIVPWFSLYLVLRFFLGLISVSIVFTGFVLCMELVGGIWRTISGVCYIFPVSLGYITSAVIASYTPIWKNNQLAITLPGLLLFSIYWFLPESPRWLLTKGRVAENVKILEKAARMNKLTLPDNVDKLLQQHAAINSSSAEDKTGLFDLFRYPNIRKKSLVLFIIWFSVYFVYYGLVMNMDSLGGNVYLNTILSGLVEIPSLGISILILLKMGRRWPMGCTMIASGIVCVLSTFVVISFDDANVGLLAARFAIACSNVIMPVYTAELFPTVVRNLGVGACNMSGGLAMVLVPYLWDLVFVTDWLPVGLLAACGILGGLVSLTLPETANQPLINTLEEGEEWGRKCKENSQPNEDLSGKFNQSFAGA